MESPEPKIHIIANCANRKRKLPSLELGSIPQLNVEKRVASWWEKLSNLSVESSDNKRLFKDKTGKLKAADLYVGGYWSIIRRLLTETRLAGFEANLWIVSAGYGLISADEEIYSYSATFTQGDVNSIDNDPNLNEAHSKVLDKWWESISNYSLPESVYPRKLAQLISENPSDYFLVIASADYLTAIKKDLLEGIKVLSSPENILIITSKSFLDETLQESIIPADARLQCNSDCKADCEKHLLPKGIRGAISASLAIRLIEKVKEIGFIASRLKRFVKDSIEESPALINFNRTKLEDFEVCRFIVEELRKDPSMSCSSLLRKLRNDNKACEQKRFKDLFWTMKRNQS